MMKKTKGIVTFLLVILMTLAMSIPAMAEETAGDVYTYYLMMKASDGSRGADYYVEDEALANELLALTINGERFCAVTQVLGADYWMVELNDDADFTEQEVAEALAGLKEHAIACGTTTNNEIELDCGGIIFIESNRGEKFVLTDAPVLTVMNKPENPTIKIALAEGSGNMAEVSGTVRYMLTINIPSGYEPADVTISGTLSDGLTGCSNLTVTRGGVSLSADSNTWIKMTETEEPANKTKTYAMTIPQSEISANPGSTYQITYDVVVNENVELGVAETNSTTLTCTDKNGSTDTSVVEAKVYCLGFELSRVNGKNEAMAGAAFTLQNAEGKYYTTDKKVFQDDKSEVTTDSEGIIVFSGLAKGTYTLTETETPAGYTLFEQPVTVTIAENGAVSINAGTGLESKDTVVGVGTTGEDMTTYYFGKVVVQNGAGAEIPDTGGVGTTFFYVTGIVLMLGAGTLLVYRRRNAGV